MKIEIIKDFYAAGALFAEGEQYEFISGQGFVEITDKILGKKKWIVSPSDLPKDKYKEI